MSETLDSYTTIQPTERDRELGRRIAQQYRQLGSIYELERIAANVIASARKETARAK